MNINDLFFALLRNALWYPYTKAARYSYIDEEKQELPNNISVKVSESLLDLADKQTVSALIADSIFRNDIKLSQAFLFEMVGLVEQIKHANQQLNDELKQFIQLPLKDFVVVKGQTIAALYPNPLLRMPGDIDFLVLNYKRDKSVIEKKWQIELPENLIDKETSFEHGGVTYEIHDSLIVFGSTKHNKFWNQLMYRPCSQVIVDNVFVPTLEPNVYAAYVFVHLFFHFVREGIGLRQMCDWAAILHYYREGINQYELERILKGIGLFKAYCSFGYILIDMLGLRDFPFEVKKKDQVWEDKILRDIMRGGNFGKSIKQPLEHGWRTKVRTMCFTLRNCWRYFWLAPCELALTIPKLIWLNVRIILL